MRSAIFAAAALSAGAFAQDIITSKPFTLSLVSDEDKLNGTILNACHIGAALESLCTDQFDTPSTYQLNSSTAAINSTVNDGVITYLFPPNSADSYTQGLTFYYVPNTNVVLPEFGGQGTIQVSFNDEDYLYVPFYVDDTTVPVTISQPPKQYNNWWLCSVYFQGYTYDTLSWVTSGPPSNPTCKKVDVKRTFTGY